MITVIRNDWRWMGSALVVSVLFTLAAPFVFNWIWMESVKVGLLILLLAFQLRLLQNGEDAKRTVMALTLKSNEALSIAMTALDTKAQLLAKETVQIAEDLAKKTSQQSRLTDRDLKTINMKLDDNTGVSQEAADASKDAAAVGHEVRDKIESLEDSVKKNGGDRS